MLGGSRVRYTGWPICSKASVTYKGWNELFYWIEWNGPDEELWLARNVGHCYNKTLKPIQTVSAPWVSATSLLFELNLFIFYEYDCTSFQEGWGSSFKNQCTFFIKVKTQSIVQLVDYTSEETGTFRVQQIKKHISYRGGSRICGKGGRSGGPVWRPSLEFQKGGCRGRAPSLALLEDPLWNFKRGGRAPPAPPLNPLVSYNPSYTRHFCLL